MNKNRHVIYVVRHGESMANVDRNLTREIGDYEAELTDKGKAQAFEVGETLGKLLEDKRPYVWCSDYTRTRQTMELGIRNLTPESVCFSSLLVEQDFGLSDGFDDDERAEIVGRLGDRYEFLCNTNREGKFWARFLNGESQSDVSQRVALFFNEIYQTENDHPEGTIYHVIFGHGVVNRAVRFVWDNHPFEWWASQKNPGNCEIYTIDGMKGNARRKA